MIKVFYKIRFGVRNLTVNETLLFQIDSTCYAMAYGLPYHNDRFVNCWHFSQCAFSDIVVHQGHAAFGKVASFKCLQPAISRNTKVD